VEQKLDSHASVRIQFAAGACAAVSEIVEVLSALEEAYVGLFRWNQRLQADEADGAVSIAEFIEPSAREVLCLAEIETVAPAQVEIIGLYQPITRLRAYLLMPTTAQMRNCPGTGSAAESPGADWLHNDIHRLQARGMNQDRIRIALDDLLGHFARLNSCPQIRLPEPDQ